MYINFIPGIKKTHLFDKQSYCIIIKNKNLLINHKTNFVPLLSDLQDMQIAPENIIYLGELNNIPCLLIDFPDNSYIPENLKFMNLIIYHLIIPENLYKVVNYAYQIQEWNISTKYCGKCGNLTKNSENDRVKICSNCNTSIYPKISPAIIAAVIKNNKILLGTAKNFAGKFYSVLAGFVEPGETLEECVKREIKEEAGISIKNIKYYKSQSWGITSSLMVGFTAEYKSGELIIDKNELVHADWFTKDNLPQIPSKISIARDLIDHFITHY